MAPALIGGIHTDWKNHPTLDDDGSRYSFSIQFTLPREPTIKKALPRALETACRPWLGCWASEKESSWQCRIVSRPLPWYWFRRNEKLLDPIWEIRERLQVSITNLHPMLVWTPKRQLKEPIESRLRNFFEVYRYFTSLVVDRDVRSASYAEKLGAHKDSALFFFPIFKATLHRNKFLRYMEFCKICERYARVESAMTPTELIKRVDEFQILYPRLAHFLKSEEFKGTYPLGPTGEPICPRQRLSPRL